LEWLSVVLPSLKDTDEDSHRQVMLQYFQTIYATFYSLLHASWISSDAYASILASTAYIVKSTNSLQLKLVLLCAAKSNCSPIVRLNKATEYNEQCVPKDSIFGFKILCLIVESIAASHKSLPTTDQSKTDLSPTDQSETNLSTTDQSETNLSTTDQSKTDLSNIIREFIIIVTSLWNTFGEAQIETSYVVGVVKVAGEDSYFKVPNNDKNQFCPFWKKASSALVAIRQIDPAVYFEVSQNLPAPLSFAAETLLKLSLYRTQTGKNQL